MIVVYRPELLNPPMDKEATYGFSFLGKNGLTTSYTLEAGVNRTFPDDIWEIIKNYSEVQTSLKLGAIRVEADAEESSAVAEPEAEASDSLSQFSLEDALRLIEDSFSLDQLAQWEAKDQRIKVRNAIAKRKIAITSGNG